MNNILKIVIFNILFLLSFLFNYKAYALTFYSDNLLVNYNFDSNLDNWTTSTINSIITATSSSNCLSATCTAMDLSSTAPDVSVGILSQSFIMNTGTISYAPSYWVTVTGTALGNLQPCYLITSATSTDDLFNNLGNRVAWNANLLEYEIIDAGDDIDHLIRCVSYENIGKYRFVYPDNFPTFTTNTLYIWVMGVNPGSTLNGYLYFDDISITSISNMDTTTTNAIIDSSQNTEYIVIFLIFISAILLLDFVRRFVMINKR